MQIHTTNIHFYFKKMLEYSRVVSVIVYMCMYFQYFEYIQPVNDVIINHVTIAASGYG